MSDARGGDRILIVDDDEQVSRLLSRILERQGYTCASAASAEEATRCLRSERFPLLLCDVRMPGESGLELARRVMVEHPETAVVMITGSDDPGLAETALELGAYGYVIKPFKANELVINVSNALRRRSLELEQRAQRDALEERVAERTEALNEAIGRLDRSEEDLRLSRQETIRRLSWAAESRHLETGRHIERVSYSCGLLARRLGLDARRCELIGIASALHDIGKIAIADSILLKPGPLTLEERCRMEDHAEIGYRILSGSGADLLDLAASIAWTHHERVDGHGYPRGLFGDEIPLEGRIAGVADVFDALTSDRIYRPAFTLDESVATMEAARGQHFDAEVLDLFLESIDEVLEVHAVVEREEWQSPLHERIA